MSRAYRIRLQETLRRVITAEDHVSTQLELLELLPPEQMADLLAAELERGGFEKKGEKLTRKNKDGMPEIAQTIYRDLKKSFNVFFDDSGAVGRRYRRMDEAGTPYCLTVDGETVQGCKERGHENATVTIRDRDTLAQERVAIKDLENVIRTRMF